MIHLLNMPFGSLTHPTLALGLIKAQLAAAGLESRVFNLNLDFARRIGFGPYETIALFKGVETQVGEWLFAKEAWGESCGPSEEQFIASCGQELGEIPSVPDAGAWLREIRREVAPAFLEESLEKLAAGGEPRVVAFSCSFFQTIASLALGRRIKERFPRARVVYGGACFHGEMGEELFAKVPWIDAVSLGEADDVLVALFEAMSAGREPAGLQGILYRDGTGQACAGPPHTPVGAEVIEALPDPDFDDFFAEAGEVGLLEDPHWRARVHVPFEASRGCWWGEKAHCTFCGLNGQGMAYRKKSPHKVLGLLERLAERYPFPRLMATDNILPMSYFEDLLPRLKESSLPARTSLHYSIKANLTREQIRALAEAGIHYVQPGIESLSSHLLGVMRKGVTALQNVYFLKCCRELGVVVFWNNLIRLPGERREDYLRMEDWIPKLVHLRPPYGGSPRVECHRFSPYFFENGRFTENLRPPRWYEGLFPAERIDLSRVAYYFDADWKDTLGGGAYDAVVASTLEWIRIWREEPELPRLSARPRAGGGLRLEDSRQAQAGVWELDPVEARVYEAVTAPGNLRRVRSRLRGTEAESLPEEGVRGVLADFVAAGLAIEERGSYLGLALAAETVDPPLAVRRGRLRQISNQQAAAAEAC